MIRSLVLLVFVSYLNTPSCNVNNEPEENEVTATTHSAPATDDIPVTEEEEAPATETVIKVDAVTTRIDSMLKAPVELPPVYYHNVMEASDEATEKFSKLSRASKGNIKIVVTADIVSDEVSRTINTISTPNADLLILIDKTCSMSDDIEDVRKGLGQIIDTVIKYRGTRLAIATYGDKNCDGADWFTFKNFETRYAEAIQFVNDIKLTGGGDLPESAYDALFKCNEQHFFKSERKRNIILVGDAPPLEKPLSDYSMADVIALTREGKIKMNFYPIVIVPKTIAEVKLSPAELATYQPKRLAVTLYPNPSQGRVEVSMIEHGSYRMEIYNIAGTLVSEEDFLGLHWTKNIGDQPNGVYILRIIHDNHKYETMRFVLQR